ncbi:type II toxin-antitoxin system ParD family antitoxin [Maridesulfovibrio bastinii]|uniref:type II toxin-antitoxin system ParD family antitoxin n=1 Tax=Maridesulfovibrio bastinii TaxID=47157 RepID=UPI002480D1F0|nr:type II toxin-antitoxin system ParD family antitoxin [Maridesulfovibrio bastinii]
MKVQSGHYNNANEVIREALRFMITNEELVNMMKFELFQLLQRKPHALKQDTESPNLSAQTTKFQRPYVFKNVRPFLLLITF